MSWRDDWFWFTFELRNISASGLKFLFDILAPGIRFDRDRVRDRAVRKHFSLEFEVELGTFLFEFVRSGTLFEFVKVHSLHDLTSRRDESVLVEVVLIVDLGPAPLVLVDTSHTAASAVTATSAILAVSAPVGAVA